MAYYNQNPQMAGVPPPAPTGYPQSGYPPPGYPQSGYPPAPAPPPPQVFVTQSQPAPPSNLAAEAGCMACLAGFCCCCCLEELCCL